MTHEQIHAALVALTDKTVTSFRNDLLVHDLDNIKRHDPCVPFLHFSRGNGTYMVHLIAADEYPAKGVLVPYLFGTAGREHCLDGVQSIVDHCTSKSSTARMYAHYWTGKKLIPITLDKAKQIASEYAYCIRQAWSRGIVNCREPVLSYVSLGM